MSNDDPAYTSPLALEGWNYVRYVGPLANPQTEPLFLCVKQGELVVAANREPSKLVSRGRRYGGCGVKLMPSVTSGLLAS
jgi:hypothetical protein